MEEQRKTNSRKKGSFKIIPPKKDKTEGLSRDEVRSMNKKKMHRRRKIKRIIALAAFGLAVVCVGVSLVLTVFFRIDTIVINGEHLYVDKQIIERCGVAYGDNLFMVNEGKINEMLTKGMPYIKSITIEREMPDTLIINVVSAEPCAAIPYGDAYVIIDRDGKILDNKAPKLKDGVALVNGLKAVEPIAGEQVVISGDGNTQDLLEITKGIADSGIEKITEINFIKKDSFQLTYDNRITLELGNMTDITEKLARAKVTIRDEVSMYFDGILDLSIDGKVYIQNRPEPEEPVEDEKNEASDDGESPSEQDEEQTESM